MEATVQMPDSRHAHMQVQTCIATVCVWVHTSHAIKRPVSTQASREQRPCMTSALHAPPFTHTHTHPAPPRHIFIFSGYLTNSPLDLPDVCLGAWRRHRRRGYLYSGDEELDKRLAIDDHEAGWRERQPVGVKDGVGVAEAKWKAGRL
eukprot:366506-Chlamydomonas_euryale.AAC.4